jgi:subtilisin
MAGPLGVLLLAPAAGAAPNGAAGERDVPVIVTLTDGVAPDQAADVARDHGARLGFVYEQVLGGFSAEVPEGRLRGLARDRRVAAVEPDSVMTIQAQQLPTGIPRSYADAVTVAGTSTRLIDGSDERVDVDIAVVDTGIEVSHPDLHVAGGTDCSGGSPFSKKCRDGTFSDGHGHGTHVAGTAAALDNGLGVVGVAPGARLWGVKVLSDSGSGYTSWIIAGIDWVVARGDIEVLNMSLGGSGVSDSYRTAIDDAVANGVTVVVAAGNSDADANDYSPAYVPSAITVSALADFDGAPDGTGLATCREDQDDPLADFSNWGSAIDIAAPGVCIRSTWIGGGYNTISGTSMASPHVAGAAALLASVDPSLSPENIRDHLVNQGNFVWTDDSDDGIQEPLLDLLGESARVVGGSDGGGGTTNDPPAASFTASCTDLSCSFTDASTDGDGSVVGWSWSFGDGTGSTAQNPAHAYAVGGTYTVSLTVTDDDGATDSASQTVTVTDPSTGSPTVLAVASETYTQFGGKQGTNHLDVALGIVDGQGAAVSGASVTIDLYRGADLVTSSTGTTDSSGTVAFSFRGVGPGCYSADVTAVSKSGSDWDGTEPTNTSCS